MLEPQEADNPSTTECTQTSFEFGRPFRRDVVARFDGGAITTDGGLLLRQVEQRTGIVRRFATCFRDHRRPNQVEHRLKELVGQRVYGLALGYEASTITIRCAPIR